MEKEKVTIHCKARNVKAVSLLLSNVKNPYYEFVTLKNDGVDADAVEIEHRGNPWRTDVKMCNMIKYCSGLRRNKYAYAGKALNKQHMLGSSTDSVGSAAATGESAEEAVTHSGGVGGYYMAVKHPLSITSADSYMEVDDLKAFVPKSSPYTDFLMAVHELLCDPNAKVPNRDWLLSLHTETLFNVDVLSREMLDASFFAKVSAVLGPYINDGALSGLYTTAVERRKAHINGLLLRKI